MGCAIATNDVQKPSDRLTDTDIDQLLRSVECWDSLDTVLTITVRIRRIVIWIITHLKYVAAIVKWATAVAPVLLIAESLEIIDISASLQAALGFLS